MAAYSVNEDIPENVSPATARARNQPPGPRSLRLTVSWTAVLLLALCYFMHFSNFFRQFRVRFDFRRDDFVLGLSSGPISSSSLRWIANESRFWVF